MIVKGWKDIAKYLGWRMTPASGTEGMYCSEVRWREPRIFEQPEGVLKTTALTTQKLRCNSPPPLAFRTLSSYGCRPRMFLTTGNELLGHRGSGKLTFELLTPVATRQRSRFIFVSPNKVGHTSWHP